MAGLRVEQPDLGDSQGLNEPWNPIERIAEARPGRSDKLWSFP